jgi:hypothetical protein
MINFSKNGIVYLHSEVHDSFVCKVPSIRDPGSMHRNLFFTGDNRSALQVFILKETKHFS